MTEGPNVGSPNVNVPPPPAGAGRSWTRLLLALYYSPGGAVAIEMTGGKIINERGTVVTFRQKCENCGYGYDFNKTTIVPAYGSRKVRAFTCPECGNYQEVEVRYLYKGPRQEPT